MTNLPNWLKWALVLPAGVLAMVLVHFAIVFFGGWGIAIYTGEKIGAGTWYEHYLLSVAAIASGAAFVHYGAQAAPHHQKLTLYVLTGVALILVIAMIIFKGLRVGEWWAGWDHYRAYMHSRRGRRRGLYVVYT